MCIIFNFTHLLFNLLSEALIMTKIMFFGTRDYEKEMALNWETIMSK